MTVTLVILSPCPVVLSYWTSLAGHVQPLDDLAEDGVVAVQEVDGVDTDVELGAGGVRLAGAGHGDRAGVVRERVVGRRWP